MELRRGQVCTGQAYPLGKEEDGEDRMNEYVPNDDGLIPVTFVTPEGETLVNYLTPEELAKFFPKEEEKEA